MGGRSRSGSNATAASTHGGGDGGSSIYTSSSSYPSSSSTLGFGNLSLQGGSSNLLPDYVTPAISDTSAQVAMSFRLLLDDWCTTSTATAANVRKVACCAALIETAKEQRSGIKNDDLNNDDDNDDDDTPVTPNEMFIVAIAALTSLQMKLEGKQNSLSSSNNNDGKNNKDDEFNVSNTNDARSIMESIGHDIENTAIPVLELLRRILPYVAHPTNNSGKLLLHQFGTLSRMLRMFVVLGYALPSSSVGGGEGDGSLQQQQQQQQRKNSKKKGGKRGGGGVHFEGLKESSKNTTEVTTFGANALLRQILKVTTTLLLVTPPIDGGSSSSISSNKLVSEKDLAKLLHSTLIPMFHDVRPKVRKAAWGCGMEIIIVVATALPSSSSLSSSIILNNENDNKPAPTATNDCNNIDKRVQHQRRVVADFLWEYCHAVMTNYHHHQLDHNKKKSSTEMKKNINNEVSSKLIHVLRFLSTALQYADDSRIRIRFGECCLETMMINSSSSSSNTGSGSGGVNAVSYPSVEIVKATLIVLLSCLEMTDREQELVDDDYAKTTTQSVDEGSGRSCIFDGEYDEAMSKFASQCLAFLLQYRPNGADSSHGGGVNGDDVNTVYGRCLMACMGRMLGKTLSDDTDGSGASGDNDNNAKDVPASKLLAIKLIPNVLTSLLNICELTSSGGSNDDQYDLCGAAFNQFVSNTIPVVVSYLKKKERTNDKIHRMSLEMLAVCIPIVQRALQIQYRSAWGSILSGGYATFTLTLARHLLLEQRGFVSGSSDGNVETSDLYCQLSSWVQTLVLSLLRLHDDVAKGGGPARTAVEYATSTIIRGMGIELFLGTVDFVYEDDYGDGVGDTRKKSLSSSSTTGGGIRDDRAWLLPLMKQSTSSWLVGNDDITSRTHLSFFQGNVLGLARKCDAASADGHRTVAESSIQKARVVELWSLFPLFCVHPLDMKESFGNVAKTVVKALGDHGRYPKLVVSTMRLFIYCAYEVYPILTALLVCFL